MAPPHINVKTQTYACEHFVRAAGQRFSQRGGFPRVTGVLSVEADGSFTV